ncbi:EAL domain-containing protein [Vibrio mangrovi]|uniref:Cyclic di-GMP phosphodiesterase Gmr n=1 Tax=Vibrio mangrovi TaxID=474394 RepID=A0A1Y6IPQ2_9VIBR|nr:EAL domain-containing protein [Vibrio mangrovi]MDW6003582.1 EAL domain-containing protein [Vibrio mangrovi]SMR99626.1 Cyclic di-GMP phosphodiesterase Gmr [Vibrio mangrovi]
MTSHINNSTQINILVVDDDPTNLLIMEEALSGLGHIVTTTDPLEGLALARQIQPQITILDIDMPVRNGLELCRDLLADPLTSNTSVMFVTSHDEADVEYFSLEFGAVDFISKPIDVRLCRLRVQNQLQLRLQSDALAEAKNNLQDLLTQLPVYVSYWSLDWESQFCNDFSGSWFGQTPEQMQGHQIDEVLPAELASQIRLSVQGQGQQDVKFRFEFIQEQRETEYLNIHIRQRYIGEQSLGYLVTAVNMTDVIRVKQALREEKEWLNVTLNSIGDAVIATDTSARVTFMNPIAERMTGWSASDAKGLAIEEVMDLRDAVSQHQGMNPILLALKEQRTVGMALNSQLTAKDGSIFRVEDSAAPIRDKNGEVIGAIIVFHDVSETVAMSVKMSHLANHDQLTDLPNRILLHDRLANAIRIADIQQSRIAMFMIDIDHFKYINDAMGHNFGDLFIKQLASRLSGLCLPGYTLARTGGDEFIIIAPNVMNAGVADSLATDIGLRISQPFLFGGKEYKVSASIGVSIYPDDSDSEENLLRHADTAMYRAKQQGRNQHCFFSKELETVLIQRHHIEMTLREAIEKDDLIVLYQPQHRLSDGEIVGCEALVRLKDQHGRLISPCHFIPIAEETGLVQQLGSQVLLKSCQAASYWYELGYSVRVSVNVAAKQFTDPEFVKIVEKTLQESRLPSHLLELEVTESALMHDFETTKQMLISLSELGISLAIDDFGTGYSSLSYLKAFPIDVLKIDRSFVHDMNDDPQSLDIVKTIVQLAKSLRLNIVAEGIEETHQQSLLAEMGCELGQGYLYHQPLGLDHFMTILHEQGKLCL